MDEKIDEIKAQQEHAESIVPSTVQLVKDCLDKAL